MKILFVTSMGGHLTHLQLLKPWWSEHQRHWVTTDDPATRQALAAEKVTWAYFPTTRNVPNAIRNLGLALRLVPRLRPDIVISTGAGVALPFFLVARLFRIRTAFVEVYDRIDVPSLTARLCYPLTDAFMTQWPEQKRVFAESTLIGRLM